jgi:spore coat protein CotH
MGQRLQTATGPLIAAAVLIVAACVLPPPAFAQTADELFSGQTLDDLWVHINARDWARLRLAYDSNTFYPCDVEWRTVKVRNAGCRSRGWGSRNPVKPGLDIEFDRYVTGQRFLGLSSVVLDNLWQDPSMLKERLSMRLFRRMGVPAPRESHVRLFVGSARQFAGLYAVVEPVDRPLLEREFGESDGYLYEFRWNDVYLFEDLGSDLDAYAARFTARTRQRESAFALYDPVRRLIEAMNQASLDELAGMLDLRGFLLQVAVENYLSDWDGILGNWGVNNFYLYRGTRGPARVIPWDKDTTFVDVNVPPWRNVETNVLMRRVWADPTYRAFYLDALRDTADAASFLEEELAFEYWQIAATAAIDPYKPETNEGFADAVADLLHFVRTRAGIVRGYLASLHQ